MLPILKIWFNFNETDDIPEVGNQIESRLGFSNIINAALFNNRFSSPTTGSNARPFSGLTGLLPFSVNPNYASPLSAFESCTAPTGESGICSPGPVCSLFGGRPSGSCLFGGVCCISKSISDILYDGKSHNATLHK